MNEQIEIEYKILLSQDIFEKLLKTYVNHNEYTQTNYYFTHPLLKQKKYMLRIREKQGSFELTLKRPHGEHRLETNIMLTYQEKEDFFHKTNISNEITDILRSEGIFLADLQQEFSLTTHRYDIQFDEGILSLDHNLYLGKEDYELEFEVYDEKEGYQKFLEIIKPYHLNYSSHCPSKIARVYNEINRRK